MEKADKNGCYCFNQSMDNMSELRQVVQNGSDLHITETTSNN